MTKRLASHAGSWYSDSKSRLNKELEQYLNNVPTTTEKGVGYPIDQVRAIIAPHAGYTYSGPTAAYAYKCIDVGTIRRVFLLGPSHHVYLDGCALSKCDSYETPLGNLELDKQVISDLYDTGQFSWMSTEVDEEEHSIEMHLPYTYKIFEEKTQDIKIVPILVGSIGLVKEKMYGQVISKYLEDPSNLFIISSDFCHWGRRFNYNYDMGKEIPIHEAIRKLDDEGMKAIESMNVNDFSDYLIRTRNTICGRHPIAVLMAGLEHLKEYDKKIEFIKYDQSNRCYTIKDSSVSYASGFVTIMKK
ncbi:MEMO1 family [Halteromyces radiatus]|uniref:MEMO1 family n=1 Tax=Halteromyces radiatus TaxID=101107 RepID=UPI00221E7286|nr:MEMO1 family [Halteromyces radiatus]KAI8096701.1 MEMO1 family [Halteromyces radiatus]